MTRARSTITIVASVAAAAFVAGRLSSVPRSFDSVAFDSCVESVALEYRDKIKGEFRRAEQEWEAKHSPYRWPVHAAVYRRYQRPDIDGYMEGVAPTRVDYHAYTERR